MAIIFELLAYNRIIGFIMYENRARCFLWGKNNLKTVLETSEVNFQRIHVSPKVFLWKHYFCPIRMGTITCKVALNILSIFSENMAIHRGQMLMNLNLANLGEVGRSLEASNPEIGQKCDFYPGL